MTLMLKRIGRDTHQCTRECEDDIHFMFACPLYNDIRESILQPVFRNEVNNPLLSDTEKLSHLMKLKHREALNFIENAWHKRQSSITYV